MCIAVNSYLQKYIAVNFFCNETILLVFFYKKYILCFHSGLTPVNNQLFFQTWNPNWCYHPASVDLGRTAIKMLFHATQNLPIRNLAAECILSSMFRVLLLCHYTNIYATWNVIYNIATSICISFI